MREVGGPVRRDEGTLGRRSTAARMLETGGKVVTPGCTRLKSVPAREPEDHKCRNQSGPIKSTTGRGVLRGDIVKGRFRILRGFHRTRFVCISNAGRKSDGTSLKDYLIVQDKQPTQYQLTLKSKWRTLQKVAEHSRARMSRNMGTSSTTQVAKILVDH